MLEIFSTFRIIMFCCMTATLIRASIGSVDDSITESWALGLLYMITSVFNIWTLLYFLELIGPKFGIYAISIQRMIGVLAQFLVIFFLLFFSFEYSFYRVYNDSNNCEKGYENYLDSFYTTFIVMLNMVDIMGDLEGINVVVVVLHVIYVFIIVILLLNYLIALMSDRHSQVMANGPLLLKIQQVSAALLVERRVGVLFPLGFALRQRQFLKPHNGKLYIVCHE